MFISQLRNELLKLFGKKRTYIGFGVFLVCQNLMLFAFQATNWQRQVERLLAGNNYLPADYVSALTVAIIMLIPQILLLMPLYVTLVGGDLVAKEAEEGTLRMILCRPISRFRLLLVKWFAGGVFSALLVLALGGMALLFARMWFPWGGLFVFTPPPVPVFNVMPADEGLRLYLLSHAFMALNAGTMFSLAFMFSCFDMKPAAATVLALSFLLVSLVLENIPFFEDFQPWLLPYHFRSWVLVYANPVPWPRIGQAVSVLLAANVTAFVIGAMHFQTRDIKS
ncbi:MAG: ABC transporter permease [Verrucomicrobia bacterium]|nr:ABC transporter permease [Verrucomicrobiota bacterium]